MEPPSKNPAKARRAADDPKRPGERCKAPAGAWTPVVDRSRCEAKGDCVEVCPYGVFEVRRIEDDDYAALSFFARIKVLAHRKRSVYMPNAGACRACGLCVVACPEDALQIVRTSGAAA